MRSVIQTQKCDVHVFEAFENEEGFKKTIIEIVDPNTRENEIILRFEPKSKGYIDIPLSKIIEEMVNQ